MMLEHGWFAAHLTGHGPVRLSDRALPAVLGRGSLMLDFALLPGETGPLPLLHLGEQTGWTWFLSISLDAQGVLTLVQRQGAAVQALTLDIAQDCAAGGRMRLTFSWDCRTDETRLTLETIDGGQIRQRVGTGAMPLSRAELAALAKGRSPAQIGPRVEWLAFGSQMQPVGPGGCFAPSTPIATPGGECPAASLKAGDLVLTADAGPQPLLWSGRIALPALGSLRPVRLCAPAFGATRDLWLLPQHRVALRGAAVTDLFAAEEVLVPAHHLVDGISAQQPDRPCVLSWHGLLLQGHHLLIADGCRVESLHIGRLARTPALAKTTALSGLVARMDLPVHGIAAHRGLTPEEARALAAERRRRRGSVAA